jgi:hypothetical protein
MAEGLDRARIADLRAGLSDGARAAFLDARLSEAERQIVVTALSHDPEERAEISSAADLLDCVGTDLIPLPPGVLAKAAAAFAAENSAADHSVAVPGRRIRRRQGLLIVGVGLAAFVLVMTAVADHPSPGTLAPSAEPVSSVRPTAQSATKRSEGAAAGRALDHAIVLAPDAKQRMKSISARGASVAASCDSDRDGVGHGQGGGHDPCEIGKATDRATPASGLAALDASYRPQVPPADNHSTRPHADGPTLRTASSRRSRVFRLGAAADDLGLVPQGMIRDRRPSGITIRPAR